MNAKKLMVAGLIALTVVVWAISLRSIWRHRLFERWLDIDPKKQA